MNYLQTNVVLVLSLCAALLLQTGCTGLGPRMEPPSVTLADIHVQELRSMEAVFQLQLRVINPNATVLDVNGLNCDLEIDGRHFATGISRTARQVPAYGSTLIPVEVYASVLDLISSVARLIEGGASGPTQGVDYLLHGKIRLATSALPSTLPFKKSGRLDMNGLH